MGRKKQSCQIRFDRAKRNKRAPFRRLSIKITNNKNGSQGKDGEPKWSVADDCRIILRLSPPCKVNFPAIHFVDVWTSRSGDWPSAQRPPASLIPREPIAKFSVVVAEFLPQPDREMPTGTIANSCGEIEVRGFTAEQGGCCEAN